MSDAAPIFGKRGAQQRPTPRAASTAKPSDPHAAFFAAARAEMGDVEETRQVAVPRSFKAAFLAGLVVGCALVGFDVTGEAGVTRFTEVANALGIPVDTHALLPAMILLGLLGGARAGAIGVILVHGLLAKVGWTSHAAYAAGGAAAAAVIAAALLVGLGHAPLHGWPLELLAGAGRASSTACSPGRGRRNLGARTSRARSATETSPVHSLQTRVGGLATLQISGTSAHYRRFYRSRLQAACKHGSTGEGGVQGARAKSCRSSTFPTGRCVTRCATVEAHPILLAEEKRHSVTHRDAKRGFATGQKFLPADFVRSRRHFDDIKTCLYVYCYEVPSLV